MHATEIGSPTAEASAFLQAVTGMARRRPVVTARAIFNENGVKLLEGGVIVDGSLYDRLVSHRLSNPLDECLSSEPSVTGRTLRDGAERLLDSLPFFAQMGPSGRIRDMLLEAVQGIPLPVPVAFQLTLLQETRPELFDHSLKAALTCAHLEREGGASLHDMRMAAAAGLLHDLGMLHIAPELLAPEHRLQGDERRPLYAHPLTGSMQLQRFLDYPREVARAVLEHHERLDGSGYPQGLAGDAISPLGRLLSLAEVVTAMFDGRRRYPEMRVSLLLRMGPQRFDADLVRSIQRLLRALPPVPESTPVLVEEVLHRLQMLIDLVHEWRDLVEASCEGLPARHGAVVRALADQMQTLQRMLHHAGATREQLALLAADTADPRLRIELWALEQELRWHLNAGANQLQRRWRAAGRAPAMPESIEQWLASVRALEQAG